MIIINRTNSSAFFVKFILIKVLFAENPSWLFGGRCEEKWEEDGRVCQLGNFWNRFQNLDFLRFSREVQVSKFQFFLRFSAIFMGPKKISKRGCFRSVLGFWRTGLSKNSSRLSPDEQGLKFGSSRSVLQYLGDPKNSPNAVFPRGLLGFWRTGLSNFFWNLDFPAVFLRFWRVGPTRKK